MNEFLQVLMYAAMPAFGNLLGGILAEMLNVSEKTLSLALHLAAGIILAVIGVELMPEALEAEPPYIPILAFVGGSAFFVLLDRSIGYVQSRFGGKTKKGMGAAVAIYIGVAIDLFSDGIMIGTGSTVAASLGLLLAIGQVPADIPEGFATIATFKSKGVSRGKRLLLAASFAIPIFLGATVGYWAVKDSSEIVKLTLLAFVAGILLTVAVEEMLTEAHDRPDSKWAALFLSGGFALFTFLSVYLGE
ncbi:MAG: ZIP family metal transporter [Hymenobacteraceae bacterium]|nr:ZIP family metal transporter [Hymenobacteraceae bacterium]